MDRDLTPEEVITVRLYLLHFVPAELVYQILNEAQYWPTISETFSPRQVLRVEAQHLHQNNTTRLILLTPRIPQLKNGQVKIVSVTFEFTSRDQGWGGEQLPGPYEGSYSWFEACIVRRYNDENYNDLPIDQDFATLVEHRHTKPVKKQGRLLVRKYHTPGEAPRLMFFGGTPARTVALGTVANAQGEDTWHVQSNVRAGREERTHVVKWEREMDDMDPHTRWAHTGRGDGDGFVEALRPGDRIAVFARAQYSAWVNYVRSASVVVRLDV